MNFVFGLGLILMIFYYACVNIPKSEKSLKSETLLVPGISDKGYLTHVIYSEPNVRYNAKTIMQTKQAVTYLSL